MGVCETEIRNGEILNFFEDFLGKKA